MTISDNFLLRAVESMSRIAPISYRRIFSGYGVYYQGIQFALITHDRVYFRGNENTGSLYLAKSMAAFSPKVAVDKSYFFHLPNHILSQPADLLYWMRVAINSAQNKNFVKDEKPASRTGEKHIKRC